MDGRDDDNDDHDDNNDSDDTNATVFPSAEELCDGIDNNCNTVVDENVTFTQYIDQDEDGFGDVSTGVPTCILETGFVLNNEDCNDTNSTIHPERTEICDFIDNNFYFKKTFILVITFIKPSKFYKIIRFTAN